MFMSWTCIKNILKNSEFNIKVCRTYFVKHVKLLKSIWYDNRHNFFQNYTFILLYIDDDINIPNEQM